MSSAPRYMPHYRVGDYRLWAGDWELIDGIAVAMTPSPFGRHERVVSNCVYEFMAAIERCGCGCRVYAGLDWIVGDDTVVRPDVMVVCDPQPDGHLERPPVVVIEVLSPSARSRDLSVKRQIYFEHRVPYYLVIDADNESVQLQMSAAGFHDFAEIETPMSLDLTDDCRIELDSHRLLR